MQTMLQRRGGLVPTHSQVPPHVFRRSLIVRSFQQQQQTPDSAAEHSQSAAAAKPGAAYQESIMLQSFGWDSCNKGGWYKQLKAKVPDMKAAGITHLWLPPPSQSVSPQGYLPAQLYNLDTKYGNKQDLMELNQMLKEAGIKPVADIVINHRCADEQTDGVWNKFRDDVDHTGKKIDWGKWAITGNDPVYGGTGNPDTGDDYGAAPDLDHLNPDLRAALKDWLNWLKDDLGFVGWRLDFARGYGAKFAAEYIDASTTAEELNVAEYWVDLKWQSSDLEVNQDEARQKMCNWINGSAKTCCAFDFPTKGILQEAVKRTQYWRMRDSQGKAPGLIGWWSDKAVTFVDNHDTGSTQNHWPFPPEYVGLGYAYILTHPGMPCIFYDHMYTWGDGLRNTINLLLKCRQRNGISGRSKLEILAAEADMYVARIDDKVMIKLGPRFDMGRWVPAEKDGWRFVCSGKDFAVWEKKKD